MIALPLNSLSLFKALFNLKLSPGHRANRPPPAPPPRQLPIVTAFLGDDLCPAHRIFGLGLKTLFKVRPGPGETHMCDTSSWNLQRPGPAAWGSRS